VPLAKGLSRGTELWIGKTGGRLQGWASYTLNHQAFETKHGTAFRPYYNREQILNVSMMHYLTKHWLIKGQYLSASGYPSRNWNPEQLKIDPGMSTEEF
ncbi:hypothetical protein GWO43_08465, partial [candidate division KSB1 bacterium]|nr:hypothetical protein [candidate division KSB1 bacterium]NIS25708.1 hypothetical protein [candidate division KSB1 bacterium]NIT70913.1 hypothetical protein [candidate division KSB1 bacterium]NIU26391.1 hypothetical protein [candidate division KSB1 bacterium]NIU90208.1 hypothetical protein [candidate division KSB1 bacterium]